MNGRQLATTERVLVIYSSGSDEELGTVRTFARDHDLDFDAVPVGDSIEEHVDPQTTTLGVTLGGDGTYLEGVRQFAPRSIPLLGVNTGTLAFLASVSPVDLADALGETIRGKVEIEERQQLHVDAPGVDCTGINDMMVERLPPENPFDRKVIRVDVFVDDEYVGEYEGNGIAIATPTGSTGVSLSAGGPIHYPTDNETLQLVPMHTHRLGVRPLVVDANKHVQVVSNDSASLLVDGGRAHTEIDDGDVVTVTGSNQQAQVVKTGYDDHFFTSIAEKLGWGARENREDTGPTSAITPPDTVDTPADDTLPERAREVAEDAAVSASYPLRELHGAVESVEFKSDTADIVTEADYKAENIITTTIENEFPDHNILSEESPLRERGSSYTWLVDPLDGTGNFAHGNPNYSVSIALLLDDEPIMGVVYAPESDELFAAVEGQQAERNGTPIATTDRATLDESMLLSGYDPNGAFLSHCYRDARGVRRLGSAALNLCYLASGSADAVWEYDTYPWDVASGVLIAREAGATLTNASGVPYEVSLDTGLQNELVGSNGALHSTLMSHLPSFEDMGTIASD